VQLPLESEVQLPEDGATPPSVPILQQTSVPSLRCVPIETPDIAAPALDLTDTIIVAVPLQSISPQVLANAFLCISSGLLTSVATTNPKLRIIDNKINKK